MEYLDAFIDKFTTAISAKLDDARDEQITKLDKIRQEVQELRNDLFARLAVVERQMTKIEVEQAEKGLPWYFGLHRFSE